MDIQFLIEILKSFSHSFSPMHSVRITILTITVFILVLLSAGCADSGGSSVESPTPAATNRETKTPTPEPTETWWCDDPELVYGNHDTSFFGYFEGVKNTENVQNGYYTIMNEDGDTIIKHQEYTSSTANIDGLSPTYISYIEYEYGPLIVGENIIMETNVIDGKIKVFYPGTKDDWLIERPLHDGCSVEMYIGKEIKTIYWIKGLSNIIFKDMPAPYNIHGVFG